MGRRSAKRQEQFLVEMRRKSIAELWFSGESVEKMAEIWKCDKSTIYRDMEWIENNAELLMRNFIVKTVPHIINRSLYQLDIANREAMKILKDSNTSKKEKLSASLAVAKTAKDVIDIVTNNDDFVNAALELDESLKNEVDDEFLNTVINNNNGLPQGNTETETESEDSNRKF